MSKSIELRFILFILMFYLFLIRDHLFKMNMYKAIDLNWIKF